MTYKIEFTQSSSGEALKHFEISTNTSADFWKANTEKPLPSLLVLGLNAPLFSAELARILAISCFFGLEVLRKSCHCHSFSRKCLFMSAPNLGGRGRRRGRPWWSLGDLLTQSTDKNPYSVPRRKAAPGGSGTRMPDPSWKPLQHYGEQVLTCSISLE